MAETKIYISDEIDKRLRERAMRKFGYGRGSISNAVEEAIAQWLLKESTIESKLNLIKEKARMDKDVIGVLLFGSHTRREQNYRDVDVALVLKDDKKSEQKLFDYLKAVDSAENKVIDIVIFNTLPLEMKRRVLNEAEILYAPNASELYDKSIETIRAWGEYGHMFNIML
jgi:predicted nucleotidyltransferase